MKSPRNDDHVLVVGIFQHPEIARAALKNLRRARFRRAAAVHGSATHRPRVEECDIWAIGWAASVVALLAIGIFIFWQRGTPADFRPAGLATLLGVFVAFGALVGWTSYRLLRQHVDDAHLTRVRNSITPDEIIVLAEVRPNETSRVLAILRDVAAEEVVTFAFPPSAAGRFETTPSPLWQEQFSSQRLAEMAAMLALSTPVSRKVRPEGSSFCQRLGEIERTLEWANASLSMSADVHHSFTLSAEWLLDNAYLIREQLTDLRRSLPGRAYGELPLIT